MKKLLIPLFLVSPLTRAGNEPVIVSQSMETILRESNKLFWYGLENAKKQAEWLNDRFCQMKSQMDSESKPLPIKQTTTQDDQFVYITLQADGIDWDHIERSLVSGKLKLIIPSQNGVINAIISPKVKHIGVKQEVVEKNEQNGTESRYFTFYENCEDLNSRVNLSEEKNIEIKNKRSENKITIKMLKDDSVRVRQLQAVEE